MTNEDDGWEMLKEDVGKVEAQKGGRGPTNEGKDMEKLAEDAEKWISEGIAEIRESVIGNEKETTCKVKIDVTTKNRFLVLDKDNRKGEEEMNYEILGNSEVRDMRERTKKGGKEGYTRQMVLGS